MSAPSTPSTLGAPTLVVTFAFEALAFDPLMMRGGTAALAWNLARQYALAGRRSIVITPAHGHAEHLIKTHGARPIPWSCDTSFPVVLDPKVWRDHPSEFTVRLETSALHLRRDDVDVYLLSNGMLDTLPQTLYPANEMQGRHLSWLKPLAFQVAGIRFIDSVLSAQDVVVAAYEPLYSHLLAAVYAGRQDRLVSTTVAMNPPILARVYRPQLHRVLEHLGVDPALDDLAEPPQTASVDRRIARYLRPTHQRRDQGSDYTSYHALAADRSDILDFVSDGQRTHVSTYRGAPARPLFERSRVGQILRRTAHKQLVGGCAIPNWWLNAAPDAVDRTAVLEGLGLTPDRPTLYHAARFDQNHKGQLELVRALDALLADDRGLNVILQCAVDTHGTSGSAFFDEVAERHRGRMVLDWRMIDERKMFAHAAVADLCVFPSKFELDGFLITMAQAMACGAVPVATAQTTLSHFRHHLPHDDPSSTGYAVPRSFRTSDSVLTEALLDTLRRALKTLRDDPATHRRLSDSARSLARSMHWEASAARRLEGFDRAYRGEPTTDVVELATDLGWFDLLSAAHVAAHRDRVAAAAVVHGDLAAYARCAPVTEEVAARAFDIAYARGELGTCAKIAPHVDVRRREQVAARCDIAVEGAELAVRYSHGTAARVDVLVSSPGCPDPGSGNRYLHPLDRVGGAFRTVVRASDVGKPLVLLLTLPDGSVAWDVVDR